MNPLHQPVQYTNNNLVKEILRGPALMLYSNAELVNGPEIDNIKHINYRFHTRIKVQDLYLSEVNQIVENQAEKGLRLASRLTNFLVDSGIVLKLIDAVIPPNSNEELCPIRGYEVRMKKELISHVEIIFMIQTYSHVLAEQLFFNKFVEENKHYMDFNQLESILKKYNY